MRTFKLSKNNLTQIEMSNMLSSMIQHNEEFYIKTESKEWMHMYVTNKRTLVLEIVRLGESLCKTLIHDMVNTLNNLTETKEYRNESVSITIHDNYIILLFK